ncbi:signal peptidase II [Lapidilactobacillus achengensis]|uniref:Lipoprotein signal peptidase n=1 Tax=Lapidilactobacillus achengensis TaxID=2486000 RepID=A0ABW1ULZ5_9LACO|nr:signal peptidase II [Lapidilactobacillus achengensis]
MQIFIMVLGALVLGGDQLLKYWITQNLAMGQARTMLPGLLSLTRINNSGAAWSSFEGQTWFFYIVTIVALAVILPLLVRAFRRHDSLVYFSGLVLILAGTLGNFIDRARQGFVVDMFQLDFINFPIFNVADMALTVGVILIFIYVLFLDRDEDTTSKGSQR